MKNLILCMVAFALVAQFACQNAPRNRDFSDTKAATQITENKSSSLPPKAEDEAEYKMGAAAAKSKPTYAAMDSVQGIAAPAERKKRKVARSAEMRFKVENVAQTTTKIEDLTKKFGGFVERTNLQSQVESTEQSPVSADSVLEVSRYNVANTLVVRVPDAQLDTFLKILPSFYLFLDVRRITADDLTLQFVSNELQQRNAQRAAQRIKNAADRSNKARLNDIVSAEETAAELENANVERLVSNRGIDERVQYASVELAFYQPTNVSRLTVVNSSLDRFQPTFFQSLGLALSNGWQMLLGLLLIVAHAWTLILFGVLLIWFWKRYGQIWRRRYVLRK